MHADILTENKRKDHQNQTAHAQQTEQTQIHRCTRKAKRHADTFVQTHTHKHTQMHTNTQ